MFRLSVCSFRRHSIIESIRYKLVLFSYCGACRFTLTKTAHSSPFCSGILPANMARSFSISSFISLSLASLGSSLRWGLFLMFLARFAYRSVESVSSKLSPAGDTAQIISVFVLPPKDACNIQGVGKERGGWGLSLCYSMKPRNSAFPGTCQLYVCGITPLRIGTKV